MDAVSEMNRQQMEVSAIQEKVITDPDSVDIHDVTVAMAKAQSSLNLAQTVIDRLVKGWNDLSQNR
jgi:flagellar hook-basal body complex protein FliE